jgi:class 3 adenylate cyclase
MLSLAHRSNERVPGSDGLRNGAKPVVPRPGQPGWLPQHLEDDFDRRALVPRLLVLTILGAGAFLEYGHGHREGHWIVLVVYCLTTVVLALASRFGAGRPWLPWAATVTDAALAVYVIADHLPRDAHDLFLATDAVSLLPAILLLIQTGMRLRRDLVATFVGIVVGGWLASLVLFQQFGLFPANGATPAFGFRQTLGFLSFTVAAGFVLYAVHRTRLAWAAVLKARWDRMLLSRFLPEGIAAEVVASEEATEVAERHACLLAVDIRGFSALTRERPGRDVVNDLMTFRRFVHDAISRHGGIVDKYLGDGVLAVFLDGTPEEQAARAFDASDEIMRPLNTWRSHDEMPSGTHIIATLHCGFVLAGIFDDGRRAEFTVLGPAMNALPRMERRSKEANLGVVTSKKFLRLLTPDRRARLDARRVERRPGDEDLPDILSVRFVEAEATAHERLAR